MAWTICWALTVLLGYYIAVEKFGMPVGYYIVIALLASLVVWLLRLLTSTLAPFDP